MYIVLPRINSEAVVMCIGASFQGPICDEYNVEKKTNLEDDLLAVDVCVALEGVGAAVTD